MFRWLLKHSKIRILQGYIVYKYWQNSFSTTKPTAPSPGSATAKSYTNTSYRTFFWIFSQNRQRRPFWMTENHFRSHFSPFQINVQLFIFLFLYKMAATFNFLKLFYKIAPGGHFWWPKITRDRISRHFRSIRNFFFLLKFSQNGRRRPFWMTENHFRSHFSSYFHKMAVGGHFGFPIFSKIDRVLPL